MRLQQHFATFAVSCFLLILGADADSKSRNPLNYLSLLEDPRIHTPSQRVHASSHFDLTFDLHRSSEHIRLSLEPNHDIVQEDSYIEYLDEDGNVKHAEKMQREDYKVYQGKSFVVDEDGLSTHVGWARIVVRRDGIRPLFEGAFTVMGNHHHIQMKSTYTATKHLLDPQLADDEDEYMAVWRDSDVSRHSQRDLKRDVGLTCASDRLAFNTDPAHPIFQDLVLKRDDGYWGSMSVSALLGKRQSIDGGGAGNGNSAGVSLKSTIGSTAGCPTTRKVALIGAATDCTYTASFNSTDTVRQHIITQVNTASDLYQSTFNITLGLRNLTVSDAACPGTASSTTPWNLGCTGNNQTMDSRLNLFSAWRGERGDSNAYWSLFTTCSTDAEVGVAWLGQLCNTGSTSQQDTSGTTQSVTGANVVAKTSTEWQVFAHESGHTFGAVHDCDSSTCADANTVNSGQCCPLSSSTCDANAQYMMNPYASSSISTFSPCSVGNICSALGRNSVQSGCLTDNKGVVTITGNQCGNGIVEEGEDCDCGGTEGCAGNTCCDATTCKFNSGAVCDPSNEGCCTTSCQFSSAGTVCRASTGSCDPQEVCSGTNGTCPADSTAKDGTGCTSGNFTGLACASGQCTSRNLQCKTLMGSYTSDNDTYACDSGSCTISCASPSFGANVCYSMQQNFLDGTPCNGDGKCENGVCSGSTVGGEVKSWIDNNKTLVIALASALGGIILLAILGCCVRACRRRKQPKYNGNGRRRGGAAAATSAPRGWDGPAIPPQMRARQYGINWQTSPQQTQAPQQGWAPPQPSMMQSDSNWYPSTPPPAYAAWANGARPKPVNSVRYA
ncbi:Metallo-peptidase family M12-domain-containing protein [Exophiala viscosa]|uniref:Disintegrin and metalloproteinase domain-containing protein B n=1 Tax=Exophiala viscosa TaxID=2486360 RepID=A0AAN6DMI5_9EURO|nr:Metallo-peptidase family M12-domain-containing protein [Exophiala viscosa]KAI1628335.1 Metallo-peptidase family M12-domain-containing protein [Exophiala viscosa]